MLELLAGYFWLGGFLALGVDVRGKGNRLAGFGDSDGLAEGDPFSDVEGAFDLGVFVFFVVHVLGLIDHDLGMYAPRTISFGPLLYVNPRPYLRFYS